MSTPLWEGWDEAFHYSYIQNLAETRSLPVFGKSTLSNEITTSFELAPLSYGTNLSLDGKYTTFEQYWKLPPVERRRREEALRSIPNNERENVPSGSAQLQNYEAHQAPLYYLLAAPVYTLFSSYDVPTRAFVLRLFSLLIGSLTIPNAFATVRYSGTRRHAKIIPLLLVLLPLLYPTIARIANDSLAVPLFSALVLLVVRYCARAAPGATVKDAIAIGVVLGFGLLTKASERAVKFAEKSLKPPCQF
ncbi:MAG TPA: glycosyltransferase family 39 protein [Terriglobia bacterium]|nr:glycosyltransferase family 39 protein [Terriglobia bacterium]